MQYILYIYIFQNYTRIYIYIYIYLVKQRYKAFQNYLAQFVIANSYNLSTVLEQVYYSVHLVSRKRHVFPCYSNELFMPHHYKIMLIHLLYFVFVFVLFSILLMCAIFSMFIIWRLTLTVKLITQTVLVPLIKSKLKLVYVINSNLLWIIMYFKPRHFVKNDIQMTSTSTYRRHPGVSEM